MNTIKTVLGIIILLVFSQCKSLKIPEKKPVRIISSTYYLTDNNQLKNIYIQISNQDYLAFDSIYFQRKKSKIKIKTMRGLVYVYGDFSNSLKTNLVLDANPTKEFNNPIPELNKFPFDLKDNEAVISYKVNEKVKYFKVKKVKRGSYSSVN